MKSQFGLRYLVALIAGLLTTSAQALEEIRSWNTDNGAKVLFVPASEPAILDVRIVFAAGSTRDGDKPGLARLVAAALDAGAAGKTAQQLAVKTEAVGALLNIGSAREMAWLELRTLAAAESREVALKVTSQVLAHPDFPRREVERMKRQMLLGLQNVQQSPQALAERSFYSTVYQGHPYASPPDGTEQSIPTLTVEDLRDFHQRYYVAANATIAIVGAIDEATAHQVAQHLVADLPRGERAPRLPPVVSVPGSVVEIDYPAQQASILLGHPALSRYDADYFALIVGNFIFGGGGFSSRLMGVVREQRGLAYSVYSHLSALQRRGPFVIGTQTQVNNTNEVVELLRAEFDKLLETGLTKQEVQAAIRTINGGFALNFDSNAKLLGHLGAIGFYDLPLDYLKQYRAHIAALSAADINAALRRHLHPDQLTLVVVGPKP